MLDHVRASSNVFGAAEALEVFLNVSIYFVFGVMVEYGIVETMQTQLIKVKPNHVFFPFTPFAPGFIFI